MNYCILNGNTIENMIVCDTDEIAAAFNALPSYDGAKIGDVYDPPVVYTDLEIAQQAITDLELSDVEQGQYITDLELMILEGQSNV